MFRRFIFCFVMMTIAVFAGFGQAAAIRDYVGMISQTFHPDIVKFLEELKGDIEKRGYSAAARSIETYLKGESGTGFVYVSGGRSYIITNYHVISQAYTLSITFEKPDGERTKFTDLTIIAADEEMDIALLAFAGGQNPFTEGLAFYNQTLQEGDDVYSAGFPGLGAAMVWQLGRGMVSNSSVRFPEKEGSDKMLGPFIQHTAQIDPGNSGGPLLVQSQGVPTGFAVVGINTRSARSRQAANFSIPLARVQAFLDASLMPQQKDELSQLNARIASFIEGLGEKGSVYTHIASFLSNDCAGENAEYALYEMLDSASVPVRNSILDEFAYSPVDGMSYAVAWTIENALRSRTGAINVTTNSVNPAGNGNYTVVFNVNGKTISSEWVNEYGIWRIKKFGDFAAGDKSLLTRKLNSYKLVTNPSVRIAADLVMIDGGMMFGGEIKLSLVRFTSAGFQLFFGTGGVSHFEVQAGFEVPIRLGGSFALIPFVDGGIGAITLPGTRKDAWGDTIPETPTIGASVKGGLMFTTSFVPGLYVQLAYKRNFYERMDGTRRTGVQLYPSMFIFGLGYSF
jgi:serine protease Do